MTAHDHGHDAQDAHDGRSFDERAKDWDDDRKVARGRRVAELVRDLVGPDETTRVLEYGAGTGLATQFLAQGPLGPVTLADPSEGMRAVMAEKVADGRLPPGARIWDLDLATDERPTEEFDLLVTVMTLHHVRDLVPVLTGFANLLADGGHLCVVDLEAEDGSFHADTDFDVHDGFRREDLARWLESSGFADVAFHDAGAVVKDDRSYPLFLAVAEPNR